MIYLASAETQNIVSSNVNDTSAGTGARTVLVSGLDTNFDEISETVILNGTTPVLTTLSYLRVSDLQVMTSGTGLENAGDITATASSAGTVQAFMEMTFNHSLNGRYTTPNGKFAVFANYEVNIGQGKDVIIDIKAGSGTGVLINVHRNHIFQGVLSSTVADVIIPPKTDLVFRCFTSTGVDAGVACAFNMIEIEEKYVNL